MQNSKPEFVLIYSTSKTTEVALIKSILNNAGIDYFVTNENVHVLYGPVDLMDIMVANDKIEEAKELLKDFINPFKEKR